VTAYMDFLLNILYYALGIDVLTKNLDNVEE